jgi:hypothetical protein
MTWVIEFKKVIKKPGDVPGFFITVTKETDPLLIRRVRPLKRF